RLPRRRPPRGALRPRRPRASRGPRRALPRRAPGRRPRDRPGPRRRGRLGDGVLGEGGLRAALRRSPCTRAAHHAYLGGLLEHTVAVATLAVDTCALHPRLDQDLLLTAAIVHDLGRTREFTLGAEIGLTDEGRLLRHVEIGLRML